MHLFFKVTKMQSVTITSIFFLFLQVLHAVDIPDNALTPEDIACMFELDIDRKTVETFFDDEYQAVIGNPLMDLYSECWITKMKFLNNKGEFNFDNFHSYVVRDLFRNFGKTHIVDKEEIARIAVQQCKHIKGLTAGDLGSKIYNCVAKYIRML